MGRALLLAVGLATLSIAFVKVSGGDSRDMSAQRTATDQGYVLAQRGAGGGLAAGVSRLSRDFGWRGDIPETRAGELTFEVQAEGPVSGPVRLTGRGDYNGARHRIEAIVSRLVDGPAALVLDADTMTASFTGTDWMLSGADARARTWLYDQTPAEGTGYARPARAVQTRTDKLRDALLDEVRPARHGQVRGIDASADIETDQSPELVALAETGIAAAQASHSAAQPRVFNGLTVTSGTQLGMPDAPVAVHVDGDFRSTAGSFRGHGLLVVDGHFEVGGQFEWNGVVVVRGGGSLRTSLSGQAAIFGALYVLHESGYRLGSAIYPFKSLWAVDDEVGALRWFVVHDDSVSTHTEGTLLGIEGPPLYGDVADVEGFTFMPDGTIYFVNNLGTDEGLYRIDTAQFDGDASTPVQTVRVGTTGVMSDDEVFGLMSKNGILYGLSGDTRRIYRIDTATGAATTVRSFNAAPGDPYFKVGGLSLGPKGAVYTNRLNGGQLELWRFDDFPSGDPVYVGPLGERPELGEISGSPMSVAPDGTVLLHQRTELRRSTPGGGVESVLDLIADVDAVEMWWEGEGGAGGASVPSLSAFGTETTEGTHTAVIPWSSGPDLRIAATITEAAGTLTTYTPGNIEIKGSTLDQMAAAADMEGAAPVGGTGVQPVYDGPNPLPILFLKPGASPNGMDYSVRIEFSETWDDPFYLYAIDLDKGQLEISAEDGFGNPVSTAGWTKTRDMDVVGVVDVTEYVWDSAWSGATRPGAGLLYHPDQSDKEMSVVGLRIPDLSVRAITISGTSPPDWNEHQGFSVSHSPLWVDEGTLPIPTFSMSDQAQIVHSAEAIGQLAALLPSVAAQSYVIDHDRFGRDLPRPQPGSSAPVGPSSASTDPRDG